MHCIDPAIGPVQAHAHQTSAPALTLSEIPIRNAVFTITGRLDRGHAAVGVNVATTGTIAQFAHGIFDVTILFMRIGTIIIGVAASAVGLITRRSPGDGLAVAGMTGRA